jgi:hypothetical protein
VNNSILRLASLSQKRASLFTMVLSTFNLPSFMVWDAGSASKVSDAKELPSKKERSVNVESQPKTAVSSHGGGMLSVPVGQYFNFDWTAGTASKTKEQKIASCQEVDDGVQVESVKAIDSMKTELRKNSYKVKVYSDDIPEAEEEGLEVEAELPQQERKKDSFNEDAADHLRKELAAYLKKQKKKGKSQKSKKEKRNDLKKYLKKSLKAYLNAKETHQDATEQKKLEKAVGAMIDDAIAPIVEEKVESEEPTKKSKKKDRKVKLDFGGKLKKKQKGLDDGDEENKDSNDEERCREPKNLEQQKEKKHIEKRKASYERDIWAEFPEDEVHGRLRDDHLLPVERKGLYAKNDRAHQKGISKLSSETFTSSSKLSSKGTKMSALDSLIKSEYSRLEEITSALDEETKRREAERAEREAQERLEQEARAREARERAEAERRTLEREIKRQAEAEKVARERVRKRQAARRRQELQEMQELQKALEDQEREMQKALEDQEREMQKALEDQEREEIGLSRDDLDERDDGAQRDEAANAGKIDDSPGKIISQKQQELQAEIEAELTKLEALQDDFIRKVNMAKFQPASILRSKLFEKTIFSGKMKSQKSMDEDSAIQSELSRLRNEQSVLFAKGRQLTHRSYD